VRRLSTFPEPRGSGILIAMVQVRHVHLLEEALTLAPRLDRSAAERAREFQDDPVSEGIVRDFLHERFGAPETLLVVAESEPGRADLGLCLIGPFIDPLLPSRVPMVLVLYVEPNARHRGLARALVEEATRLLGERGFDKLAARAGHNDDALISMGERWGFVRSWELMLRE
jgi:GNAT superfamily N-acetyltransferase